MKFGLVQSSSSRLVAGVAGGGDDSTPTPAPTPATITTPANTTTSTTMIPMASMYNATARPPHQLTVLSGDEITTHMKNLGQLTWNYSMERGMICDGETQLRVWNRMLDNLGVIPSSSGSNGGTGFLATIAATATRKGKHPQQRQPTAASQSQRTTYSSNDCTFLLLEPPFVPSVVSEGVDCILFRELGLGKVARLLGPCMAAIQYHMFCQSMPTMSQSLHPKNDNQSSSSSLWINDNTKCCCVVDSGYSFTHVVPTQNAGEAITTAIRRLDLGGKVLTNLLKEFVTYRQWNMMDEYHIVNDVKEQLCFVSDQFELEMTKARNIRKGMRWFDREYLLPDFVNTVRGSVRLPEPLQRKREMEEMEQLKLDMERVDKERRRRELADEAMELQDEANNAVVAVEMDKNRSKSAKENNVCSKKQGGKKKKRRSRNEGSSNNIDRSGEEDDDIIMNDTNSDTDSDDETDQQRLHRLKAMRDAERKRREQESLSRQALAMSVERFAIPEVLFRPSDIGLDCGGIAEAISESITSCPPMVHAAMYHNVLLVGGNAKISGFRDRVETELRKLAPTKYEVRVYLPEDPVSYAWEVSVPIFDCLCMSPHPNREMIFINMNCLTVLVILLSGCQAICTATRLSGTIQY